MDPTKPNEVEQDNAAATESSPTKIIDLKPTTEIAKKKPQPKKVVSKAKPDTKQNIKLNKDEQL